MHKHERGIDSAGYSNRDFPYYTKLAVLAFLYCLNLKIRWKQKSVTLIKIYGTVTIVNLPLNGVGSQLFPIYSH